MTKRLIIFLIRMRLGVGLYQKFRFVNQKTRDVYYFTEEKLMKITGIEKWEVSSSVSLNWLLDPRCEITTVL